MGVGVGGGNKMCYKPMEQIYLYIIHFREALISVDFLIQAESSPTSANKSFYLFSILKGPPLLLNL